MPVADTLIRPALPQQHVVFWTGYINLATTRRIANGQIPWSEIQNYCDRMLMQDEDEREEFSDIIYSTDGEFHDYVIDKMKSP